MDAFQSFHKILSFARDLNAQLQVPEIVFVGHQGHGKSSLIEAFVGFPLFPVGTGGCTKRPVVINLINNPSCNNPKVTIKKETSRLGNVHGADKVLDLDGVEKETTARNELVPEPLVINYESKSCWNLTLIDTPGLANPSEKSSSQTPGPKEIEDLVFSFAKPTNRFLVFVEELKEGTQSEMVVLAKKIDPKFDRTAFVFTKFSDQLKTFGTSRDLNRFLSGAAPDTHTPVYFVSLVPASLRSGLAAKEKYNKKLQDLVNDDLNTLEQLQYDRRYHPQIGFVNFKKHLIEYSWNKYQVAIPELLKRLRAFKKNSEGEITKLEQQETALTGSVLRGNASRYAVHFLHCIEKLIEGTLEGNPQINGQTLKDEKSQDETGEWVNWEYDQLKVDANAWKIAHADSKLYGGQQFERLLAEFRALVDHLPMEPLTMDEIATALGPQKLTSSSNLLWAASDIAQRQLRRALVPLLDQLFKRAKYIMKRLVHIVVDMIQASIKNKKRVGTQTSSISGKSLGGKDSTTSNNETLLEELSKSPFFVHYLNDLFEKFVDKVAEECKNKCKDEFYSTRLIFWESANIDKKAVNIAPSSSSDDIEKAVNVLAKEIFSKTRSRISQNILLKSYNFFLVPMGSELWAEIQGHITCLNDTQLNELFEVEQTLVKLKEAQNNMTQILSRFDVKEEEFVSISNGFSKISPRDIDF